MQVGLSALLSVLLVTSIFLGVRYLQATKQVIAQQEEAKSRAEASTRERELLLARVCHDLKNPIAVIQICAHGIDRAGRDGEGFSSMLKSSIDSMMYLTDQLLSYTRSFVASSLILEAPISSHDFFRDVGGRIQLRYRDSKTRFEMSLDPEAPAGLLVEGEALKEVLVNLLDNAFRHTENGFVKLEFLRGAGSFLFKVSDNGTGIAPDVLERLFDPFVRGTDDRADSVGLGLSIVKKLVEKMGAKISVSSELGKGTEVSLQFPDTLGVQ